MRHARQDYNRFQDPDHKIPEDEPVFLLRGQDKLAWKIVKIYSWLAEASGCDQHLVEKASRHAELMKIWKVKKKPDL